MRPNPLKRFWKSDRSVINGWLSIPSAFSAEVMAHQGWDSLTIDLQHGVQDYASAVALLQGISTTDVAPLVRVPWLDEGIIMKMLDAGAYGIICPMINSADEAARFVAAGRYPPAGRRSYGPIRAQLYGGTDYLAKANEEIALFAMIETKPALDNLEEILSVPGLDAVYVGPVDLSAALGCTPKLDPDEAAIREAIELIVRKAKERNIIAGIHNGSAAHALSMVELGYRFVTVSSDARMLAAKSTEILGEMRRGLKEPAAPRPPGGSY